MRVVADTNVVVRFLVADDAKQHLAVVRRLEAIRRAGGTVLLPTLVIAETSWVLATAYGRGRAEIQTAIGALVRTAPFVAEDRPLVDAALAENGPAGIADYLVLAYARREGAAVLSFDAKLLRESDVEKP